MTKNEIVDQIVKNARNPKFLEGGKSPAMALAFIGAVAK